MEPRDAMLGRVRDALGRKLGQKADAPPEPLLRIRRLSMVERIRRFQNSLEALDGKVFEAAGPAEVRDYLARVLQGGKAIASNHPFLKQCGVTEMQGVRSGLEDSEELRNICADSGVGITSAYCLLAETGTIVLRASPEEPRMISLLPPVHIAIVPRDRLLTNLDEMFSLLPRPVDSTSATVMITGPSRTGDIEGTLVRGVHGPANVHVVIVQGKDATE